MHPVKSAQQRHAILVRSNELVISAILRGGVYLSGSVILLGVLLFFIKNGDARTDNLKTMHYPTTLSAVFSGLGHGDPLAIIMLGLILLIATPVSRITVSIFTFAIEKDWRYVAITTGVLAILLVSFLLGKAG